MSRSTSSFIDASIRYPRETHAAVREFARSKPWRGSRKERLGKFRALHARLCEIYDLSTKLKIVRGDERTSVNSFYRKRDNTIVLIGRLSVVTYLHLFAHAIDCRGEQVVKWSVNLFKRRFPISFGRCRFVGHLLVRGDEGGNYTPRSWGVEFTAGANESVN